MKNIIKKILPEKVLLVRHYLFAMMATIYYRHPSKKMIIIGVTGTKGKTSATNFIWSTLTAMGFKTGIISTANIRIGEEEMINDFHMTMPGRFAIQRFLRKMANKGCDICVVETTSEGIKQYRHKGVLYDIMVFTNLTPEHLPSHEGSFEKYKEAKGVVFKELSTHSKSINREPVKKTIIANRDSEHADYYLSFDADRKVTFALDNKADYKAENITEKEEGVSFTVQKEEYSLSIPGSFNVYNALPALAIGNLLEGKTEDIKKGLLSLKVIPGRVEEVKNKQNFKVYIDYAHEKESITQILKTGNGIKAKNGKVIILLGAEGGGRDKSKRAAMGEISAKMADYVVVSNVDPYEDDPTEIAEDIAVAAEKNGKKREEDLFVIEDRREGINKALSLAQPGDVVLITGKGVEPTITIDGKIYPWDDKKVTEEELEKVVGEG